MIVRYVIQHRSARKEWVDEQAFTNALDCYSVISKWGVLWPRNAHRVIERCILSNSERTETTLSVHSADRK